MSDASRNPYLPPKTTNFAVKAELVPSCPNCSSERVSPAPYDWFRGRRAPKAIQHMLCADCKAEFNGETGVCYPPKKSPLIWFVLALIAFLLYFGFSFLVMLPL